MPDIERLLAEMTLAEKIGQLNMLAAGFTVTGPVLAGDITGGVREGRIGSVLNVFGVKAVHRLQLMAVEGTRLGIPLLFGFDVVHGQRTIFPVPLAEAAAMDPVLWERTAREAAMEAARDGVALTFAPMIDVSRDPRWGRIVEGPGEDPTVASLFAEAKVRGFQGRDLASPSAVGATAKHFVAYGAPAAGRDYASVDVSERTLHEVYLPPFEAAVKAGVVAVMPAFHDLAGEPMTAHGDLLDRWLRVRTGFDGVVISDYHAVAELIDHGVAADVAEAAALALKAGVDIDMMGYAYEAGLPKALDRGLVDMADVDRAVRRVLALKQRLGLFDAPYGRGTAALDEDHAAGVRALAREAARRSVVLLDNAAGVLPFPDTVRRIALVGPLGDAPYDMLGSWSAAGDGAEAVSILNGLRAAMPGSQVRFAAGVPIDGNDEAGIAAAIDLCRQADAVVLAIGEGANMSGEAASRSSLDLPGRQRALAEAVLDLGKPTVAVICAGRPLAVDWLVGRAGATLAAWFLGSEAGNAIADILTGAASPSGRLPLSWPRNLGQVPIFFAERTGGRPDDPADRFTSKYLDVPNTPLFPFGHGLTYGDVTIAGVDVERTEITADEAFDIVVDLRNEGRVAAEETVFLFARDLVASVARPAMDLKSIARCALAPGESGTVVFSLPARDLSFPGRDLRPVLEPGEFELMVGPSADRKRLIPTRVRVLGDRRSANG
ncbi:glycoside hydrolase family 3 N-terminal domain-containing protein [Chthonobacter albigriseus]|uniref:glycoside hydrolase family 3 N-terminal domain-containing protein n=1 Tax=Chthonobacter albigriseus TaxID=1683161 RepID=UPI0015EF6BF8|nr:glycoside hydrolase family 3 N-terminal domain-containing protein [Chthonobacter albigriseus]